MNRWRNVLFGLSALLMLGHSLVPHDHSGDHPPKFILWELFSVDLGGDHLQHFAPSSCETAPEDANQQQLPVLFDVETIENWPKAFICPGADPFSGHNRADGYLTSWSRRPPPSKIA
jgi:hypothetical protein